MNLTMEDPESSSCPPPSDWATLSALLKPGGKKKRLYPGNVGHRIRMLSRYVALGLVSGFALSPESRILKFLPRTLEFLPNNPGAWKQASTAYLTETTSFSSILRTKATALEAEDTSAPWWSVTKSSRCPLGPGFPWTATLSPQVDSSYGI